MRIFALETDREKLKRRFLSADEHEILTVRYHVLLFLFRAGVQLIVTAGIVALGIGGVYVGLPPGGVFIALFLLWLFTSFKSVLQAFIDWQFDFLLVTNDKVVIVNQTTIIRQEVRQMHLENFASVTASTQFLNIFPFGMVCFDLKEGTGVKLCLRYIPDAENVAAIVSDTVEGFQRPRVPRPL